MKIGTRDDSHTRPVPRSRSTQYSLRPPYVWATLPDLSCATNYPRRGEPGRPKAVLEVGPHRSNRLKKYLSTCKSKKKFLHLRTKDFVTVG